MRNQTFFFSTKFDFELIWFRPQIKTMFPEGFLKRMDNKFCISIILTNLVSEEQAQEVSDVSYMNCWNIAETFEEIVYLSYKYVRGELYASYTQNERISKSYKRACSDTLESLTKSGVYIIGGQEPNSTRRSYLDCVFLVHDTNVTAFEEFLQEVYNAGVNVAAMRCKGTEVLEKLVYAEEKDFTLFDEDYEDGNVTLPKGFKRMSVFDNTTPNSLFNWSIESTMPDRVMSDRITTHTRYHCEFWSPAFNDTKVEIIVTAMAKSDKISRNTL